MTYQTTIAPIPEADLAKIPCFRYINPEIPEEELEHWDQWFLRFRGAPEVYSIRAANGDRSFYVNLPTGGEVFVDWRVYRTWNNTFHLRYKSLLQNLGLPAANPHIHPDTKIAIARLMESGQRPNTLKEALAIP